MRKYIKKMIKYKKAVFNDLSIETILWIVLFIILFSFLAYKLLKGFVS